MRELPSTRQYVIDMAEPGTVGDANNIVKAFDDVYMLLSSLLIDDTIAEENGKIRRALAMFINAYANVDRKSPGLMEMAVFQAWMAGAAALGIKPIRYNQNGDEIVRTAKQ
jgi:hemoglobin-like flavoprotein